MAEMEELLERARLSIIEEDEDEALAVIRQSVEDGIDLMELLVNGFGAGNKEISDMFDRGEISVAELLYASDTMKTAAEEIFGLLDMDRKAGEISHDRPRVLLATVAGDIHDIGKGIVAAFLRNAGFDVIDLGCEVSVEAIAFAAREFNVDIIGTSALLTSSLLEQKKLEKHLRDIGERDNYITMIGGAPCTDRWAAKIGADAYTENAGEAVSKALELIQTKDQNSGHS